MIKRKIKNVSQLEQELRGVKIARERVLCAITHEQDVRKIEKYNKMIINFSKEISEIEGAIDMFKMYKGIL